MSDSPVVKVLKEITDAIELCTSFCAHSSVPVSVTVIVTCADGLQHEYERDVDG